MSLQLKPFKSINYANNRYLINQDPKNKHCESCDVPLKCSNYKGSLVYLAIPRSPHSSRITNASKQFCIECILRGRYHYSLASTSDIIEYLDNFVGAN